MTFKRHAMGDIKDRPPFEQFEADFHQLLRPALVECTQKGNKKREGYIMGAFRKALENYRVVTPEQRDKMTELSREEACAIYNQFSVMQKVAQDLALTAATGEEVEQFRKNAELMPSVKVKMMVLMLMEVANDVSGV